MEIDVDLIYKHMKTIKPLILAISILIMASCTSKEEKMQKLALDYLTTQLKSTAELLGNITVDNIEFGEVDSLFATFDESAEGKAMKARVDSLKSVSDEAGDYRSYFSDKYRKRAYDAEKAYDLQQVEYFTKSLSYKGTLKGWNYKTKVKFYSPDGRADEDSVYFYFNKEKNKVIGMQTVNEINEQKKHKLKYIKLTKDMYHIK